MAVPSYATDLNDIFIDGGTTWTLINGGRQTNTETDDYIQGSSCWSHDPFSSGIEGGTMASTETVATDDAIFYWLKCDVVATLATRAAGGMQAVVGSSATAYKGYYVAGSDDYAAGGWICAPIDPTATASVTVNSPTTTTAVFGARWNVPGTGASKGYPMKVDAMRHGRQIEVTAGEVANPATFASLAAHVDATSRRWGIVQGTTTGLSQQGIAYWGTATTAVYSRVSNKALVFLDTLGFTSTDFTQVIFANASTDVVWDGMSIVSLDTLNRGIITVNNNASVEFTNSVINDIDTTADGGTNSMWDGTKWIGCNAVTSNGGSFLGCQILTSTVAADAGAFVYNETVNPDGELDGMTFTQGSNAHHAIEFGASIPSTITLRDMTFTDFDADTTNGAALNFLDTTGTITVTLVNTTQPTYKSAGATIEFATNPVTVTAKASNTSGTGIQNARVFLYATSTTGSLPAADSVTISNSGTTATVTHTAHGLKTNDQVQILGASHAENNGVFTVTVTTANAYTYTMSSAPGSSPTGTITSTFVFLFGLTDVNGEIDMSRSLLAAQSAQGWARKASAGDDPKYKGGTIPESTISASADTDLSAVMIEDE